MKTISGFILTNILKWKICKEFPDIKKSIIIFAPHTSYYDALFGKLFLFEIKIKHKFLSKKELFFFPMNIAMKMYGSIPVGNARKNNAIYQVIKMLKNSEDLHVVLSPEGTRSRVTSWDKGFYYMAHKANVPIIVGYIDYRKKEIGVKGVIDNLENLDNVMEQITQMYHEVSAKYPEKFSLEINN